MTTPSSPAPVPVSHPTCPSPPRWSHSTKPTSHTLQNRDIWTHGWLSGMFDNGYKEADSDLLVPTPLSPASPNVEMPELKFSETSEEKSKPSFISESMSIDHSLACDWLHRSVSSDVFDKILRENLPEQPSWYQQDQQTLPSTDVPVSSLAFEETLELTPPSPIPPTPSSEAETKRKRGRPSKPLPDIALVLANSKVSKRYQKREKTPVQTPVKPCSRPQTDKPEDEEAYRQYRQVNNDAARISRLRRKEKELNQTAMVEKLTAENLSLKTELADLRSQFSELQSLLDRYLSSKN